MTTKVVVDAHAGWDVEVEIVSLDSNEVPVETKTVIVTKHTIHEFYIHSHMRLGSVKELKIGN